MRVIPWANGPAASGFRKYPHVRPDGPGIIPPRVAPHRWFKKDFLMKTGFWHFTFRAASKAAIRRLAPAFTIFVLYAWTAAAQQTTTYVYQGNGFTSGQSGSVTGTFTFQGLPEGFTGCYLFCPLESFSISVPGLTVACSGPLQPIGPFGGFGGSYVCASSPTVCVGWLAFQFENGFPAQWQIYASRYNSANCGGGFVAGIYTFNSRNFAGVSNAIYDGFGFNQITGGPQGGNTGNPGTWTLAGTSTGIRITTPSVPAACGMSYDPVTLMATGGSGPPYTWSVPPGSLPPGLTLSPSGVLSGALNPESNLAASYTFTVTATDSANASASATFTLRVAAMNVKVSVREASASSPTGTAMLAQAASLTGLTLHDAAVACGVAGFEWEQKITNKPCYTGFLPGRILPVINSSLTVPNNLSRIPPQNLCTGPSIPPGQTLTAVPATSISDPPPGGTKNLPMGYDPFPYYYPWTTAVSGGLVAVLDQEISPLPACSALNTVTPLDREACVPLVTGDDKVLAFYDDPTGALPGIKASSNPPPDKYIGFTTWLVGVDQSGNPVLDGSGNPLRKWTWNTTFNGTSGGVRVGAVTLNPDPIDPGSGTGGITITSIDGIPQSPPSVTCSASPNTLWPPDGNPVVVAVSGIIAAGTQPIPADGTTYAVTDKYGQDQPAGSFALDSGGSYSFAVPLIAARNGDDKDGRTYTINVFATDQIGNVGSCQTVVTVPHDQGN